MTAALGADGHQLDLAFEVVAGRSVLARRHVGYPFNVTAPLRSSAAAVDVIVQSVSGGLYGGEQVAQRLHAGPGARAVVRMPSASVVHTSRSGEPAHQRVSLWADKGASLSYLPRLLILFPGSKLVQATDITVAAGATVLVREGFMTHDPATMRPAERSVCGRLTVRRADGDVIAMDRLRVCGDMIAAGVRGGTDRFWAFGGVWLIRRVDPPARKQVATMLASRVGRDESHCLAITGLRADDGLLVRVAATDGGTLETVLDATVNALLEATAG